MDSGYVFVNELFLLVWLNFSFIRFEIVKNIVSRENLIFWYVCICKKEKYKRDGGEGKGTEMKADD